MDSHQATLAPISAGVQIGTYHLLRELGVGGMGSVYLAEDSKLERKVALKFLAPQLAQNEEFRQRFLREARSAARLNHTNIVTVYEVGDQNDRVYLAMEYVEGRSLREMIDTRALTYEQSLAVFTQLCTGLKKAHDSGIVHRDLKPANIMVTADYDVKILDFGLAKGAVDGNLTETGTALGTVNYMSPEQALGTGADHRSDIFAIGILLFELFSGVNPFVRGYVPATIHAIVYESAGVLAGYKADLPEGCQAIVDKAMAKQPEDRYQRMDDLLADLARLKAGQAITPAAVAQPALTKSDKHSLAILHLHNLGGVQDEFLTYGITEDLIVDLSRLGSFKVVPMYKILKYKDSNLDPSEIARQLNVSLILDGSLHRSGSAVRVSAQLVDVNKDDIVWSNRWEVGPNELARIKSALAEGISGALSVDSSVLRKADVGKAETSNPEAYDQYLKGKFALEKRQTEQELTVARQHFQRALELDPSLILARIGLARILLEQELNDQAIEVLKPALADARRRKLRGEEGRVLYVMGDAYSYVFKFQEALEHLEAALPLLAEVNDFNGEADALGILAAVHMNMGHPEKTLALESRLGESVRAGADRALAGRGIYCMGGAHELMGNHARAMEIYEDGLQLMRGAGNKKREGQFLLNLANLYAARGGKENIEIATAYLEEARLIAESLRHLDLERKVVQNAIELNMQRGLLRQAKETAIKHIALVEGNDLIAYASSHYTRSFLHYLLGEYDDALECADRGFQSGHKLTGGYRHATYALTLGTKAMTLHMVKGYKAAAAILPDMLREAKDSKITFVDAVARAIEGEVQFYAGNWEHARPALEAGILLGQQVGLKEASVYSAAYLGLMESKDGKKDEAVRRLRDNVRHAEGHFSETVAKRALGQALLEHGASDVEKSEGRRSLMQALGLARQQECVPELTRIQQVLDRNR